MIERWKDVVGYEGLYQVSDLGRVKRLACETTVRRFGKVYPRRQPEMIRKLHPITEYGYLGLRLTKGKVTTTHYVHRLVLEAWVGPCPHGCVALHGPGGKLDNSVSNLSYGTLTQNMYDKYRDGTPATGKLGIDKFLDAAHAPIISKKTAHGNDFLI